MNRRRATKLTILCMVMSCLFISGCMRPPNSIVVLEKGARASLHTPSNLTVKVVGETVYTYGDTTIPVGDIMKESLEKNLKKNKKFSLDKSSSNQYLVGIDIIKYEPRIDPEKKKLQLFQYPLFSYSVIVCDIKIDNKGEKIIGNKLFTISAMPEQEGDGGISMKGISPVGIIHGALTHKTAWRDVIEDAAKKISDALNDVFPK